MWIRVAVFLYNVSVFALGKINYCGSKLCRHTNAHTFCQFSDGPGPQCMGFMNAPLSDEEKMRILIRLNLRRAAAAEGRLKIFPGASNMMKLTWVDELAREAQLWANQCEPPRLPEGHDACRDLYSVTVGQCVASVVGEAPGLRPESMVDLWYMQNMFYKGNVSYYIPPQTEQLSHYGDFAQLLYAQSYLVGCGRSRFMVPSSGRMRSVERLVCNFAPRGPSAGRAVWAVGGAAGNCPPRSTPDAHIPALCTFQHELDESVDQDNLMSLEAHILLDTIFEIERNESLNYIGSIDEIYLTKVAVVSMKEIVAIQDNGVQKRNVYNSDTPYNAIKDDPEKVAKSILRIIETTDVTQSKPSTATFSTQEVKLIGRPKSYNMEDLNYDNDIEEKMDNRRQFLHEYPVSEKEFDLDYEFTDFGEEPVVEYTKAPSSTKTYRTVTTETTTTTPVSTVTSTIRTVSTVTPSIETTAASETKSVENLTVSTEGLPQISFSFTTLLPSSEVTKINNNDNVTLNTNDTDALLEEYLNDPETVKKLQEELERMEQTAASTTSAPPVSTIYLDQTERAEKVRRAVIEERQDMGHSEHIVDSPDNGLLVNLTDLQQYDSAPRDGHGIYPSPPDDRNKTFSPAFEIARKYLPFFNQYKNDALSSNNRAVYNSKQNTASFVVVLLPILLASVVL